MVVGIIHIRPSKAARLCLTKFIYVNDNNKIIITIDDGVKMINTQNVDFNIAEIC